MALSQFQFLGYKILKSIIELDETISENSGLEIGFKTSGTVNKNDLTFDLNLSVIIKNSENTLNIEINSLGNFKFEPVDDIDDISNFFYLNASAILFPYIRAYIGTLTNLSGLKAINLPTLNLTNLAEDLKKNTIILN
ncbi:protein-export chaperone SecB [Flavobacterium capsici]|uniref:Protein-export chaperone SecB n=1 Tax=Flavobacterium capsici TaxID=3075618 RepID=A0AA96EYM7_9FLAO|nr:MULTISPECIES: protein-export chaperone SecB [unclassified Flavobacterium]WNM19485.1 protein-export chaperone SecB [Flavobacterium sp. PMR2A8]WNM20874.1 protein-export chaperone SecB [Flavobacterium sp. PMTSA4]